MSSSCPNAARCVRPRSKNAVEDPAVRQRFRSFVNSENPDANVVFMPERGQIRPATPEERRRTIPIAAA